MAHADLLATPRPGGTRPIPMWAGARLVNSPCKRPMGTRKPTARGHEAPDRAGPFADVFPRVAACTLAVALDPLKLKLIRAVAIRSSCHRGATAPPLPVDRARGRCNAAALLTN